MKRIESRVTAANILYSDGSVVTVGNTTQAQRLYLALSADSEKAGVDEGAGLRGKTLESIGGRNEFERWTQKKIIDWAENERIGRKRVLLIGDSIRMRIANATGYVMYAYRRLIDHFNITHIPHNTGGTKVVLIFLDNWLSCKPDIVHVNAGLHDLATVLDSTAKLNRYCDLNQYSENVRQIVRRIKKAGVKNIVWALCTPVQEDWHKTVPGTNRPREMMRKNEDIVAYNKAAVQVMNEEGVEVNDLYSAIMRCGVEQALLDDGVHLSRVGSQVAGDLVAEKLIRYA